MVGSRKLAGWQEEDFGWRWISVTITVTLDYNICYIEGMVDDVQNLVGVIDDEQSLEGIVDDEQSIEGKIGCGEKV